MDSATIDLQHQFYDMLMQSQYWSPERMRDYQRSQLSQLLRHAKKNVPFYESRLDAVMKPNGDIDWDRWGEIPIVKRSDLIEHRDAMLARELPPGHGKTAEQRTSGSTGRQATITTNGLVSVFRSACLYRSHIWHGVDWTRNILTRSGENPALAPWPDGERMGFWGPSWDAKSSGESFVVNRATTLEQLLEMIGRKNAGYLTMGPKPAMTLAMEAKRIGTVGTLDAIFSHGEGVGDDERRACSEWLGARIIELYSSKEGAAIAHPCEAGALHVNAETLLVEVLGADGVKCSPGETGRVVITPFYSTAQPLIRYDQGDLATVGRACSCGRNGLTLAKIEGRTMVLFRHPDGRSVARTFPESCRRALSAGDWQIAQTGATGFELRYVPNDWDIMGDEDYVAAVFRGHYFSDAVVTFRRVKSIPLTAAGKRPEYVNEWGD